LFLAANPAGTSLLRLDEEAREIAGKVRGAWSARARRGTLAS
jgi:hypothetical protein